MLNRIKNIPINNIISTSGNWLLKHSLTVVCCVAITALGIIYLANSAPVTTTIGQNISTNDLTVAGNASTSGNLSVTGTTTISGNLNAKTGRTATIVVAASDATAAEKAQADYVLTGSHDESVLAGLSGNISFSSGHVYIDSDWHPNANSRFIGQGEDLTYFQLNAASIFINASNVEMGQFTLSGTIAGAGNNGALMVYTTNGSIQDFYFHDIKATVAKANDFQIIGGAASSITNVRFERVQALSPDGMGFYLGQANLGNVVALNNITFDHCYVYNAGVAATRLTDWITGFDFAEGDGSLTVTNIKATDCRVVNAWESAYHFEAAPTKTNCVLENCYATGAGQKASPSYGAGYFISNGDITLSNCYTSGGLHGVYIVGGSSDDEKIINLTSVSSVGDDYYFLSVPSSGKVKISGGHSLNAGKRAFMFYACNNVEVEDLRITNPTGYSGVSALLDACNNCSIRIVANIAASIAGIMVNDTDGTSSGVTIHDSEITSAQDAIAVYGWGSGITNLRIINNKLVASRYPILCYNAGGIVASPEIRGNNWNGSTNDSLLSAALTPIMSNNINKSGVPYVLGKITNPLTASSPYTVGYGGSSATVVSARAYTVTGTDVWVTLADSSNSDNVILIKDPAGNTFVSASHTLANQFIPAGYTLTVTFTGTAGAITVFSN